MIHTPDASSVSHSPPHVKNKTQRPEWLTEDEAWRRLRDARWKRGVTCPSCGATTIYARRNRRFECRECRSTFSVRTGTVMQASNLPFHVWYYAMGRFILSKKGVSSYQLAMECGIRQATAWFLLHRLRTACNEDHAMMLGTVEIDETFLGGKEKNKHWNKRLWCGRGAAGKQAVFGMRLRHTGHVIAKPVDGTDYVTLSGVLRDYVKPRSMIYSDDASAYDRLAPEWGHAIVDHKKREYVRGAVHTNGIESVWAMLKRLYHGTYHQWSDKHGEKYINECTFRLNHRDVFAFERLWASMDGKRLTYNMLMA